MINLGQIVKNKISNSMNKIPYGRDLNLRLFKKQTNLFYRGVYESFDNAQKAISKKKSNDYDIINTKKDQKFAESFPFLKNYMIQQKHQIDDWFNNSDYPLLYWLSRIIKPQCKILELGGMAGHFFYSIQKYLSLPEDIKWTIAELHEAVKLGKIIAKERSERRLFFIDSDKISLTEPVDIFASAGTLQYMKLHISDILQEMKTMPNHLLIHNTPMHHCKNYWTIQNLGLCELPYRIYSYTELTNTLQNIGYTKIAEWIKPRAIDIPFYRSLAIKGYMGFYLLKNEK